MANTVKTTFEGDAKPLARTVDRAERDIRRYEADRERGERRLTDLITKQAETQYRARVAAQKRATQDILTELRREERERDRIARETAANRNALVSGVTGGLIGGGAVAGGLIVGAAAITAVRELTSAVSSLSAASFKLAADFQQTRAAMSLFAGGASSATEELKQLSDLSRKTPGLGLKDAEAGAVRLRALGFQAATVQQLLEGLAKQKILSGASSEALDRVTLNLAQLSTGSGDLQDIKDLVTNLPTIRKEITQAFGSLEGFKSALKADPTSAIQRFAKELSGVQAPAGGANDAIEKLTDEFTRAGRTLGEPILEPLTKDLRDLTQFIAENQESIASLGVAVADVYRGASLVIRSTADYIAYLDGVLPDWAKRAIAAGASALGTMATGGLSDAAYYGTRSLQDTGESIRKARPGQAAAGLLGDLSGITKLETQALKETADAVKNSYDIRRSAADNYYKILESRVAVSGESEARQAQAVANIRRQSIQQQLADLSDFYRKSIAVAEDKEDLEKKTASFVIERGKLESELALNNIALETKLIEIRKKQAKEAKEEADKRKKEAEELQKAVRDIFDGVASGNDNPYVKFLMDAEKFSRSLLEVTKGLTAEQRSFLKAQNDANIARNRNSQRGSDIADAYKLRLQARDFRRGYTLTGPAAGAEVNRDLAELFSKLRQGKIGQSAYDAQVIQATEGVNIRSLSQVNRFEAASARERQAGVLEMRAKKAESFHDKFMELAADGTLKVSISEGTKLDIVLEDKSSSGAAIGATQGAVNARYK